MYVCKCATVDRLMKFVAQSTSALLVISLNHRRHSHSTRSSDPPVNRWMCTTRWPGRLSTVSLKDTMVGVAFYSNTFNANTIHGKAIAVDQAHLINVEQCQTVACFWAKPTDWAKFHIVIVCSPSKKNNSNKQMSHQLLQVK